MIDALDHVALSAADPATALRELEMVLGRKADRRGIALGNMRIEVRASDGSSGLAALAVATADVAKAQNLLQRRAVPVTARAEGLTLAPEATHGVPIRLVPRGTAPSSDPMPEVDPRAAVSGLDHVVIRTPNPERAVALYAGRLGLSLRLDRSEPAWGMRLLFFRCGDLIVEVAHGLKDGIGTGPDQLWGLSWRVPDVALAHARLQAAGVAVSDRRTGRRPGTQVFTVKSHTGGVPTLMLGPA